MSAEGARAGQTPSKVHRRARSLAGSGGSEARRGGSRSRSRKDTFGRAGPMAGSPARRCDEPIGARRGGRNAPFFSLFNFPTVASESAAHTARHTLHACTACPPHSFTSALPARACPDASRCNVRSACAAGRALLAGRIIHTAGPGCEGALHLGRNRGNDGARAPDGEDHL